MMSWRWQQPCSASPRRCVISASGNHPLVDGNKRTALASLLFFYDLNGMRVTLSHDEAFDLVIAVVVHDADVEKAADLLRRRTTPR